MSGLKKLLSTDLKGVFGGLLKERELTAQDLEVLARFQQRIIHDSSVSPLSGTGAPPAATQTPGGTPIKSEFERLYVRELGLYPRSRAREARARVNSARRPLQ